MGNQKGPCLPDIATLIQAGIDPKSRLPKRLKCFSQADPALKENARRLFRIMDEQRAVNRFKWYNLPAGLSSQELERLLYYRYSLCFFYEETLDQFFFMPYALDGGLDWYGRYNRIHPIPIVGSVENASVEDKKIYAAQKKILDLIKLNVVKDVVVYEEEKTEELLTKSAVILRDYTNQQGQLSEPRWSLNDHLLDLEADLLCFMRTNYLVATGIQGLRVQDADSASEVDSFANQLYQAARTGNPYIAITAKAEIQEIQPNSTMKASEFFLGLQSIDNMLLTTYGIENNGMYEKKAHILESENAVNATNVSLIMEDSLAQRQNFCNIVNSIWDLGIWCEIAEPIVGYDVNGDGVAYDEATGGAGSAYSAEEPDEGGEE